MPVPFIAKEFELPQADGTTLAVRGWGDQHRAVFMTSDGMPVVRDPNTGFFRPAANALGTSIEPGSPRSRSAASVAMPSTRFDDLPTPRWRVRYELRGDQPSDEAVSGGKRLAPPPRQTVGDFTGLCLPIAFVDVPAKITPQQISDFCNQPGYNGFGNNGSVFDYFLEISGGKLNYRTVVAPLYTARQPLAYYADAALRFGQRAEELIVEALDFHRKQGFDFSALTVDAQLGVYAMNVFYAGEVPNKWREGLWPHSSRLPQPFALMHNKSAVDYQVTAAGDALALGVYCHENGHMLCDFPDLYQYSDTKKGVGRYCLMCLGSDGPKTNPTHVGAYLKLKAGWGNALPLISGRQTLSASTPNSFFIHRRNATEYLLIEARRKAGRDAGLFSSGIAIWHVDELGSNTKPQEAPVGHQNFECSLLQADGLDELQAGQELVQGDDYLGDAQDLIGVSSGSVFGKGSRLGSAWWDGSPSGVSIHSVESSGADLSFTVVLDG